MVHWHANFETGDAEIDSQHQLLIDSINHLESVARVTNPDRMDAEFVINLIDFIESYIQSHFAYEENCMARFRCPAHAQNKAAHDEFLVFFQQFKDQFESEGCRPEILQALYNRCSDWIQSHILRIDIQLRPCRAANPPG